MPAYVFSQVTIVDNDKYQQEFLPAVLKSHEAYGVKYLARTGDIEALEGHAPMRCVILEFQDIAHAHAWHQSPEFQHAREIGHLCLADVTVLLIPGSSRRRRLLSKKPVSTGQRAPRPSRAHLREELRC